MSQNALEVLVKQCISACQSIENPKNAAKCAWGFMDEYCSYGCRFAKPGANCPKKTGHECFMENFVFAVVEHIADKEENSIKD